MVRKFEEYYQKDLLMIINAARYQDTIAGFIAISIKSKNTYG